MAEVKSRKPKDTKFRQQTNKRWHPLLTPLRTIVLFIVVGVIFIPIGVTIIAAADNVVEVESEDYSAACCIANCSSSDHTTRVDMNPCYVNVTVTDKMEAPVYLYYKISNFYQNHRRYVKSRSDAQLASVSYDLSDLGDDCEQQLYVKNADGTDNTSSRIYPCGLVAWSMFNDSFQIMNSTTNQPLSAVSERGIAWQSDIDNKFRNSKDGTTGLNFAGFAHERSMKCSDLATQAQRDDCAAANIPEAGWCYPGSGYCHEDEHFIVWMRTAARPNFRKLYSRIDVDLEPGTYTIMVSNGRPLPGSQGYYNPSLSSAFYADPGATPVLQTFLWPSHPFGEKNIVLSTTSWVGGKNAFLGWAYLVVGILCIVLAIVFAVKLFLSPRQLGASAAYAPAHK